MAYHRALAKRLNRKMIDEAFQRVCKGRTEGKLGARYLLIDRNTGACFEEELELLTNNAFHSSTPQLRSVVDRLRRERGPSRDSAPV